MMETFLKLFGELEVERDKPIVMAMMAYKEFTSATYSDINDAGTVTASNIYNTSYTYADLRGNFSNVQRNGRYVNGSCYSQALLDNMTYAYNVGTNQISSISDAASATLGGYRSASGAFTYDANGNIKSYAAKGISNINYNHLNLPILFDYGGGKVLEFTYDASGNKLKKVVKNTGGAIALTQDYISGIEYKNATLEAIFHSEGRLFNNSGVWVREYTIKDHLGNARVNYADLNNDGVVATPSEVLLENNYDPYGMNLDGAYMNHTFADNQYKYNGKEFNADHDLNWMFYGARWYDPSIARFPSVDPVIDKFPFLTPYNYASNEPIRNIDLWGLQGVDAFQNWVFNKIIEWKSNVDNGTKNFVEGSSKSNPTINNAPISSKSKDFLHNVQVAAGAAEVAKPVVEATSYIQTLASLGTSAAEGGALKAGTSLIKEGSSSRGITTVGRWMSSKEYSILSKTGKMIEGAGGQTGVSIGGPESFKAATKGSVYAEFQVSTNSLIPGGKEGWYNVIGPNASKAQILALQKQGGEFLPQIQNLSPILQIK